MANLHHKTTLGLTSQVKVLGSILYMVHYNDLESNSVTDTDLYCLHDHEASLCTLQTDAVIPTVGHISWGLTNTFLIRQAGKNHGDAKLCAAVRGEACTCTCTQRSAGEVKQVKCLSSAWKLSRVPVIHGYSVWNMDPPEYDRGLAPAIAKSAIACLSYMR